MNLATAKFIDKAGEYEIYLQISYSNFKIFVEDCTICYQDTSYSYKELKNLSADWIQYLLCLHAEHKVVYVAAKVNPAVVHTHVNIRVVLDRKRVGYRLNLHRGGVHLLAAHFDVLAEDDLALKGYNRVNGELI